MAKDQPVQPSADEVGVGLRKGRLEALSDGVFSVALTLLALTIVVPTYQGAATDSMLWGGLHHVVQTLFVVLLGFVVVGSFWLGNHLIFHYIDHTDRYFTWLNVLYLFAIVILPYSTLLIANYPTLRPSVIFFGVNQLAAGLLSAALWLYAARFGLFRPGTGSHDIGFMTRRLAAGPVLVTVGIAAAFVYPLAGLVVYACILILYLLPGHVDEHFSSGPHGFERGPGF